MTKRKCLKLMVNNGVNYNEAVKIHQELKKLYKNNEAIFAIGVAVKNYDGAKALVQNFIDEFNKRLNHAILYGDSNIEPNGIIRK